MLLSGGAYLASQRLFQSPEAAVVMSVFLGRRGAVAAASAEAR
jgi:hypothetical protein